MIVKIAPVGERVTEVNLNGGHTVADALSIAEVMVNGRKIILNNKEVEETTIIKDENSLIVLAPKMKGGR